MGKNNFRIHDLTQRFSALLSFIPQDPRNPMIKFGNQSICYLFSDHPDR